MQSIAKQKFSVKGGEQKGLYNLIDTLVCNRLQINKKLIYRI